MPKAPRVKMFTWTLKLLDQKYRGYRKMSILKKGLSDSHPLSNFQDGHTLRAGKSVTAVRDENSTTQSDHITTTVRPPG